ncbi:endolytic transglycosylase MltG [Microcella sp.]|uniref:endolytic transglycosylase MltG n=1 Tax=Microcella sp. TaxID=1913979 RepID=UPI00299F829B|nr:endolytic transglycosylase MltG [Microcella sp.]MDX2026753.1 endolytic transglycosylase MltG [Microcella sp.]
MTTNDAWDDIFRSQPGAANPSAGEPAAAPVAAGEAPLSRRAARESEGRRRGSGRDARRTPPTGPRRRRWPWVLLGVFSLLLGIGAAGATYVWMNYESQVRELLGWELPNDYEGSGNGTEVTVVIRPGDIGEDVARTLQREGVTMSFTAFYELLLADSSIVLFPGTYLLQEEMSAQAALDILRDPANRVTSSVTIPEGTTITDALGLLSIGTEIPFEEFEAAAIDPTIYGIPDEAPSLEGYLFPATYEFEPGLSAQEVIQVLVDEMFARLDARGVAPVDRHRILTMAALVQREAGPNTDDFGKIARVFYNRLESGWRLQSDATVAYGTGNFSTVWTTDAERADASNPYNTYANDGLPIGPIGLPGEVAIDAAITPTEGPWFFFVPINLQTGETVFSETADQHEAAAETLRQWCRASDENAAYCE